MSNECGSGTQEGWTTISGGKTEEEKNDRKSRKGGRNPDKESRTQPEIPLEVLLQDPDNQLLDIPVDDDDEDLPDIQID